MIELVTRPHRRLHKRPNHTVQFIVALLGGIAGIVAGYFFCVEMGLL